jgi:hypothetical protein
MKLASFIPRECLGYDEYTMLPWSALVDLHAIAEFIPVVERWDSTSAFLARYLNISSSDVAHVKDSKPYQFQMYDDRLNRRTLKAKFLERYDMEDLHDRYAQYRLLHLGSMFGTSKF